jgi:hypothetical protein
MVEQATLSGSILFADTILALEVKQRAPGLLFPKTLFVRLRFTIYRPHGQLMGHFPTDFFAGSFESVIDQSVYGFVFPEHFMRFVVSSLGEDVSVRHTDHFWKFKICTKQELVQKYFSLLIR